MAAPAPDDIGCKDMAEAQACVSALLAARGQAVSPAEAQKLACILSDLRLYGELEPLRTPGFLDAAYDAARRAPADWQAWNSACFMTGHLVLDGTLGEPLPVADAVAAGAPAFALDCARLFSDQPDVVADALQTLRVLESRTHAREWPGMPDILLAALAAHPQHAQLVVHATQLLLYAAAENAALTSLVLERAGVVTAALIAQGDHDHASTAALAGQGYHDRASFCCIALLDWAALRGVGKDGSTKAARDAMMTPAVVRATLRVLNADVGEKTRVDACARLLRYTPPSSVDALPGVATALVGAINARPVEALFAVSVVFRSITDHTWDVSKMVGAELRAAGGLLPLTRALRTCVAVRGESDALEAETARGIASAAYIAAMCTPPGHDDADVDEALRAGAAVSALALASRHSQDAVLVTQCFGFLERIAVNPARAAAVAAAGAFKVGAAAMRQHPEFAPVHSRVLKAFAAMTYHGDDALFAAFADAGLIEAAASVLAAGGTAEEAAIAALTNSCHAPPANQARAAAAGVPAALLGALRAHLADAPAALRILQCFHAVVDNCTAAAVGAAATVPVLVDAMTAHLENAELQGSAARAFTTVFCFLPADRRSETMLQDKKVALLAALVVGLRRHAAVPDTVNSLAQVSMCLCCWGVAAPPYLMTALAQVAHPDAPEAVLLKTYNIITQIVMRFPALSTRFTAQQLSSVLEVAQRHGATNIELAAMPLTVIAAHVRDDASLLASPLFEDALAAAVAVGATASSASDRDRMRIAAATLLALAFETGVVNAPAAGAAATRAGLLPLLEEGGPLSDVRKWELLNVEEARPVLIRGLQAAKVRHDAAACSAPSACARCAQLRAAGKRCGLPGCGASRRAEDADRTMAKCGDCRRLAYCCSAHQREDWARHKPECRAAAASAQADDEDEEP